MATRREAAAAGAEPARLDARAALAHGVARLRDAGLASLGREAGLAAELLLLHVASQTPKNDAEPNGARAASGAADAGWSGEPATDAAGEIEYRHGAWGPRRDRAWLYAHPEYVLSAAEWEAYEALLARRASGVPVQYLTGVQEFWGLEFEVTPSVLIPRPETEHVVEVALERLGARGVGGIDGARSVSVVAAPFATTVNARLVAHFTGASSVDHFPSAPCVATVTPAPSVAPGAALNIADVGTGSGCLAVALATELPGARIVATDISAAALKVARRNALRHGVGERVRFVRADLLDLRDAPRGGASGSASATLAGREGDGEVFPQFFHQEGAAEAPLFDLIVSNPPYVARDAAASLPVEVRDHEPHEALFGGATGVEIYARLIAQAAGALRAGGVLVLELGYDSLAHVQALLARAEAAPDGAAAGRNSIWSDIRVTNDLAGVPRVISATRCAAE
jgi:release factor glutamine methyltransferase